MERPVSKQLRDDDIEIGEALADVIADAAGIIRYKVVEPNDTEEQHCEHAFARSIARFAKLMRAWKDDDVQQLQNDAVPTST